MAAVGKSRSVRLSRGADQCRRKFLRYFPEGFRDEKYEAWERGYKWNAHVRWTETLNKEIFRDLLAKNEFGEICARAIRTLSGTNLLFSFESMALRDALKTEEGSRSFANGLFKFIYGPGALRSKFESWCTVVESLPKKQSRVFTHPVVTVFGAIALPSVHIFLKPIVTRRAADRYGFNFQYAPRPSWDTYSSFLSFADAIRSDLADLRPKDMIDVQSFIWVQGSSEYP
jgi:hypothetical protein